MSVALYMDEHVSSVITDGLRARGVDVLTVQDDGIVSRPDPEILDRADQLGRVVFTRDQDFLAIAAQRQADGISFRGVIYAHQLRLTIGQCISQLELIATASDVDEYRDRVEYLPL